MFRKSEKVIARWRSLRPRSAALLWALVIALLLVAPMPGSHGGRGWFQALEALGADKLVHLALFGVQAVLVRRWLRAAGVRAPGLWAVMAALTYGALTEALQVPLPDRHGDPRDLAADGIGALLGVLMASRKGRSR